MHDAEIIRDISERLSAAVFGESPQAPDLDEWAREIGQFWDAADERWKASTGLPAPRGIDDWLRLAAYVGVPAERILSGDFTPGDVKLIAEGLRMRESGCQPPAEPETPTEPAGKGNGEQSGKRGPYKTDYDPEADAKLFRDWKAAKAAGTETIAEFCKARGLDETDTREALERHRSRERRRAAKGK